MTVRTAAQILGMNICSIRRCLAKEFIAGEQVKGGVPWQTRITDDVRTSIVRQAYLSADNALENGRSAFRDDRSVREALQFTDGILFHLGRVSA